MASNSKGTGTGVRNGVRSTMNAPFGRAMGAREGVGGGRYGSNAAPFDKPQSMGGGGIPTKFMDGMSAKPATTANSGQATPVMRPTQNVRQRRFKQ